MRTAVARGSVILFSVGERAGAKVSTIAWLARRTGDASAMEAAPARLKGWITLSSGSTRPWHGLLQTTMRQFEQTLGVVEEHRHDLTPRLKGAY